MIGQDQVRWDGSDGSQGRDEDSAYEPPRLDVLGSVEKLTAAGRGNTPDGDGLQPS